MQYSKLDIEDSPTTENRRNYSGSLEELFSGAYNFLEAYVTAKRNKEETFIFRDGDTEKTCFTDNDTEIIRWWLTYSENGKELRRILKLVENRIPIEGNNFTIRSLGDINKGKVPGDLFTKFMSELIQFYLDNGPLRTDAISRGRKEKAHILFIKLGLGHYLGATDQEVKNVCSRLLNTMNHIM